MLYFMGRGVSDVGANRTRERTSVMPIVDPLDDCRPVRGTNPTLVEVSLLPAVTVSLVPFKAVLMALGTGEGVEMLAIADVLVDTDCVAVSGACDVWALVSFQGPMISSRSQALERSIFV